MRSSSSNCTSSVIHSVPEAPHVDEVSSVLWKINRPAVLQLPCQRLEATGTVTAWLRAAVVRYVPRDSLAAANLARKRRACVRRVDKHQQ